MKNWFFIIPFLVIFSCSKEYSTYATHLQGYWEIDRVEQNSKVIRQFTVSPIVDYWQIAEDNTGFRKKVMPNLEGKIVVTQHSIPFVIKIEDNKYNIHYNDNGVEHVETVVKASKEEIVITNTEGLTYYYKPYEPIDLNDE